MNPANNSLHVGIDEAGRGCLAGPVYAGAAILLPENLNHPYSEKIRDSKKLSAHQREELFKWLQTNHRIGIGFATVEEIERFNILNASLMAMQRAFDNLSLSIDELQKCHVFVDGNQPIKGFKYPQTTVVGGDDSMKCISAASIVAKVSRDHEMSRLDGIYQGYGLAGHKGYATEVHRAAIKKLGPTEIHRKTFGGVREFIRS